MCLVHSRADVKWDRLRETNFNIVLLRGGKGAQALLQPGSGADASQALRFSGESPNTCVAAVHLVQPAGMEVF